MVKHRQRHGSKAFRPRKRSPSQMPTINFWPTSAEKKVLGFAGYKVGMTHYAYIEANESPNKGNEVAMAGTVLEVPSMVVWGVRAYDKFGHNTPDILTTDEKILKAMCIYKKSDKTTPSVPSSAPVSSPSNPSSPADTSIITSVCILCYTQPGLASFGKKAPDSMEIAVGGKDANEKLEYAKSLLGKELSFNDVFKPGEFVDTVSVTKGKGTQGAIKRFGVSLQRRKATGKRRHVGTLGPWTPSYVMYTTPMAGQMGYHKRTELNKQVIKVGAPAEINPKGGFLNYGLVKTSYVLLRGSVAGPRKRLIRMRKSVRQKPLAAPNVLYVSLDSKQ